MVIAVVIEEPEIIMVEDAMNHQTNALLVNVSTD